MIRSANRSRSAINRRSCNGRSTVCSRRWRAGSPRPIAWPGGNFAITIAGIVVLLLGTRADQAYAAALLFIVGIVFDLALSASVLFAVLPGLPTESFAGLSLVIGFCLVPIGALLARAH